MNWNLEIGFHWPHHSFMLGWEIMEEDDKHDYSTYKLYLFFVVFNLLNEPPFSPEARAL